MTYHDPPAEMQGRELYVRAVRDETREADFICSTDALDRYGERVEQSSWRIERFLANPVVLFGHNSKELPIGQAKNVGVIDGALQATLVFASERANPLAERVWQSIKERTLRAVSVGFVPHTVRFEKEHDQDVTVLADCELFELSVVPIPANHEALAKMKAKAIASARNASAAGEETAMDETTKAALEAKDKALAEAQQNVTKAHQDLQTARASVTALEAKAATLTTERDAANERAAKAEAAVVKVELEALVGKKIAPAEVDGLAELAVSNRGLYERQIKAIKDRADMGLLERTIGAEQNGITSSLGSSAADEFVELMNG